MKRKIIIGLLALAACASLCVALQSKANGKEVAEAQEVKPSETIATETVLKETIRIEHGRYYLNGTVITNDGNEWWYSTREISSREPYDGMPVTVVFSDNGTTEKTDDIIEGVVFDRETAIYDELEKEMSQVDGWTVTRNGNEIRISVMEENEND